MLISIQLKSSSHFECFYHQIVVLFRDLLSLYTHTHTQDDVDVSSDGSQDGIQSEGRSEVNARTIERWVASVKKVGQWKETKLCYMCKIC